MAGHEHGPGHFHHHGESPAAGHDGAFAIGAALNLGFVVAEAGFGFLANSLALLADAGHNLGDVLGLFLAWGAAWLTRRRPTLRRTYGYGRSSILAALINAAILLVAVGAIVLEAILRLSDPKPAADGTVMAVAGAGIVVNGVMAWLFASGQGRDLNIRAAFLHMLADAGVSAGVVVAAAVTMATGWLRIDPAVGLAIAGIVVWGTWGVMRDAANLALDAVPEGVDRGAVEAYLRSRPGVVEVHDLHIWALSTTETALTAHLVRPERAGEDSLLAEMNRELGHRFQIRHATFQFESGAESCHLAPDHVV